MKGMQRKTIRKILRKKIEEWLESITDKEIQKLAKENVIVTGGAIPSMLMGDPIKDFDFYLRTLESTKQLTEFYVDWFKSLNDPKIEIVVNQFNQKNIKGETETRIGIFVKSAGVAGEEDDSEYEYYESTDNIHGDGAEEYIDKMIHGDKNPDQEGVELPKYRPVFMSQNAITLKNKIQLVIRFYGEPDQIHSNYDFQHAMCSYDYYNDKLVLPSEALESMMSKTLYYKGSLYPICSMFRCRKFIEREWTISAGEMLKIAWQISELDLNEPVVLKEQLTGVDAAYFYQLIQLIEDEKKKLEDKDETLSIDSIYISQLIDKIFNT